MKKEKYMVTFVRQSDGVEFYMFGKTYIGLFVRMISYIYGRWRHGEIFSGKITKNTF